MIESEIMKVCHFADVAEFCMTDFTTYTIVMIPYDILVLKYTKN